YLTTIKTQKPQTIINKHTVKNKDYIFEIHAYPTRDGISIYAKDITQKNKAETLYKNVVELSPESILTVDTRGVITSCNTSATKLLGHAKDELVGKHFSKLGVIRVKDLPKYLKLFSEVLRGKITKPIELTFYRKDGRPILCEVRVGLLKENGKIIGIQTVSRDITEQKRIEHRILESQQKFKGLFQDNPEAAVFVDSKFQIMDINPRFKELFGYSLKEVIGKRLLEVIIPEEKQEEGRMLDEKAKKSHVYYDTIRKRKDGTLVSVALSAAPITVEGQTIGYMGLYKEITDQKRVEKELKQSRRHFQTLFNLMVDPVAIVDGKGKILEVTKKAEEITGFKREELVGKNFLRTKIATTKSKAIMMKNLAKRMMGRQMAPYEVDMLTREGKKLPHEINAAKIVYKGKPADMVVFRDVSERKKMREKLRVVGRLTRHDVRNKLSAITGNTYLVRKKLSKDHEVNGFLDEVDSSCRQVERIFDFARNYERLGIEKMSYIDVEKTIREATSLFSDHKGTDISSTCKGLKVLADSLLRQIFYNLIDNSLKYGEKVNQIIISCKRSENDLKLIFDDDGVGIPKAKKEKIFHEGYGEGSGYGLYLIRKICEVYNWTIQETGECGKGAQFTITIPRTNEEEKENYKLS
ncbi:MAG: PAS domain S-box protein, partial [Candidatus Bathyarchaeota archaeon]